jgi:cytochrome c
VLLFRVTFLAIVAVASATSAFASDCVPEVSNKAWAKCSACHSLDQGDKTKTGPNLHGVIGRKAGSVDGFAYSTAFKSSDFTWSIAQLDAFIASPKKVVPGNRMPFGGLQKQEQRKAILCKLSNDETN